MSFLNWLFSDAAWVLSGNVPLSGEQIASRSAPPDWVRGKTIFLDLGWFSFLPDDLLRRSLDVGQPVFRVRAPEPGNLRPKSVSIDTEYRGISLRTLCEYELCVAFDCMPAELDNYAEHSQLIETIGKGKELVDWSNAVLDYFAPTRVAYPQGYVLPAAALRLVAQQRGLSLLALENTFRKDRFCWDDQSGITLATPVPMQMFESNHESGDTAYFATYQQEARSLKSAEHSTGRQSNLPQIDARKVLFIGQVNSDSSVLFHIAPGFSSQMDVVSCVADFVQGTPGTAMMLKVHPKEVHGTNPLGLPYSLYRYNAFKERYAKHENQRIFIDELASIDILNAIAWADICVTINSQAGLEAAAMGKPVILCGDAHYDRLQSVAVARNGEDLRAALVQTAPRTETTEAQAFFKFYCENYARPATVSAFLELLAKGGQTARGHRLLSFAVRLRDLKRFLQRS